VPSADPARLAEAMRAIVQMGAEARIHLGLVARRRIVEHYSLDSMVEQYRRIYEAQGHRH
jgi:glycosyltransferase involved in cell wall biosynthesis